MGTELKERRPWVRRRGAGIGLRSEATHFGQVITCWRSYLLTSDRLPFSSKFHTLRLSRSAQPQSSISSCTYCAGINFLYQMHITLVCNTMHYPRKTPTPFLLSITVHTSVIQVIAMIATSLCCTSTGVPAAEKKLHYCYVRPCGAERRRISCTGMNTMRSETRQSKGTTVLYSLHTALTP